MNPVSLYLNTACNKPPSSEPSNVDLWYNMKFASFPYLFLFTLTGCFYGKVKLSATEQQYIPYQEDFQLIFKNSSNDKDTLLFAKENLLPSNFDFHIDKGLGRSDDRKRPYMISYSTHVNLPKTISRSKSKGSYIKYYPLIFSFYKYQDDPNLTLYYNIDGRWHGSISFDTIKLSPRTIGKTVLNDVFIIENTRDDLFSVSKLYWSVKYGLIRIDEKEGESWTVLRFDH